MFLTQWDGFCCRKGELKFGKFSPEPNTYFFSKCSDSPPIGLVKITDFQRNYEKFYFLPIRWPVHPPSWGSIWVSNQNNVKNEFWSPKNVNIDTPPLDSSKMFTPLHPPPGAPIWGSNQNNDINEFSASKYLCIKKIDVQICIHFWNMIFDTLKNESIPLCASVFFCQWKISC